ncbi:hypothetical protein EW026_g7882 [Hermanssonia centrifuga]|uniref:DNA 3'-5' helicase n=1 Tax=Hermanssonia centrifuga TaxID=98765 RepID=A0A4S4K6B9_9APHY|nr:hypothetical protein EW026_g7882 [Hermanssonia centrifuga]
MVRSNTLTVVVSPTNALEIDMVNNLAKLGITAAAINADTLAAARLKQPNYSLWEQAKEGKYQIIFLSPEMLASPSFRAFIDTPDVRLRLGLFCVDECHLVDEWGADFRKPYASISSVRPWLPEWTSLVALTATLEPGRQTDAVTQLLGFRKNDYFFEKRNCERRNVDIVMRTIQYPFSTEGFRDLDWLIPANIHRTSDIPKTLLYCESIDFGSRVVKYLRTLLPNNLQHDKDRIIWHMHSLNCLKCKEDGLMSLYQCDDDRETGIHVSTDVLGVGLNMHDYDRVICFLTPSSLSSMVQRIGRTSRGRGRHGIGYIYVKKSDVEATMAYLHYTKPEDLDHRILPIRDENSVEEVAAARKEVEEMDLGHINSQDVVELSSSLAEDLETIETVREPPNNDSDQNAAHKPSNDQPRPTKAGPAFLKAAKKASSHKISCPSLRVVIAAHIQEACISRQINIIYQNPAVSTDCGRCSSCKPQTNPEPRPLASSLLHTMPDSSQPSKPSTGKSSITKSPDVIPAYMQLDTKDVGYVTAQLEKAALQIRIASPQHPDALFIGAKSFLPRSNIQQITTDLHLVTSETILKDRLVGWRYWDQYGNALWKVVDLIRREMQQTLLARHDESLAKKREHARKKLEEKVRGGEEKVRAQLVEAGLDNVKRVVLRMSERSMTCVGKENQPISGTRHSVAGSHSTTLCSRKRPLQELTESCGNKVPRL